MKKILVLILLVFPSLCFAEFTYPMMINSSYIESKEIAKVNTYPVDHVYNNIELWSRICRGIKAKEIVDSYLIDRYAEEQLKKYVSDQWAVASNGASIDSIKIHKKYVEFKSDDTHYKVINGPETQELYFIFWYKEIPHIKLYTFCYSVFLFIFCVLLFIIILKKRGN